MWLEGLCSVFKEDVFYGGRKSKELLLYENVSVLSMFQDPTTIQHFFSINTMTVLNISENVLFEK